MKQRFLLFMMTALLSVGAWAQSIVSTTVFSGSQEVSDGHPLVLDKAKLKGARVGSELVVTIEAASDGTNIPLKDSPWTSAWANQGDTKVSFLLPNHIISDINSENASVQLLYNNNNYTVTNVTLYNGVNLTSNFEANKYDNNNGAFQLKKSILTNASEGDILQVSVSSEDGKFNSGWHMLSLTNGQGDFESMGNATDVYNAVPTSTEVTLEANSFSDITIGSLLTFNTTVDGLKAVSGETTLYDNIYWCENQTVFVTDENINTIKDNGINVTVNKLKDDSNNDNTLTVTKANPNGTIAYWRTNDFSAGGTVNIPLTSALLGHASEGEGEGNLYLGGYGFTASSVDLIYKSAVNIAEMSNGTVVADRAKAAYGETVTLTVNPVTDYKLGTLTVTDATGAAVSTSGSGNTYSFTMPATAVTVSATFTNGALTLTSTNPGETNTDAFESTYKLGTGEDAKTLTVSIEKTEDSGNSGTYKINGTISASATTTGDGTSITLTPTPDPGYKLNKLIVEKVMDAVQAQAPDHAPRRANEPNEPGVGIYVETTQVGDNYTFTMPDKDVLVTALFAEKPVQPTMTYDKPTRTITITNTAGNAGKLHYKLNGGDEQTSASASNITIAKITVNTTVKAWITNISDDTDKSDEVEETFKVAAQPTVAYTDGDNTVSLSLTPATTTNTADATLYYTTDGNDPTTDSTQPTADGTIDITEDMTIKVLALDAEGNYSEIVEQSVTYIEGVDHLLP